MWNKTGYNVQESRERLRQEGENTMRKTESQKIALCGMLGALSVVLLLIGAPYRSAPTLRRCPAFLLIPVLEDYGPRYALTLYATVSILAVLFVPETELAFSLCWSWVLPGAAHEAQHDKKQVGALDHKICCIQCGHRAGLSFCCLHCSVPLCWTSCWPMERPCWRRFLPRATCPLAVRPGAGCADAVLPSGGQAKTEKRSFDFGRRKTCGTMKR